MGLPHSGQEFQVSQSSSLLLVLQSYSHCGHFVSGIGTNMRPSMPPTKDTPNPTPIAALTIIASRSTGRCENQVASPAMTPVVSERTSNHAVCFRHLRKASLQRSA